MRPGRVIRFRVNPTDCISVVDVIEKLGLHRERLSFDQACRIALSSLLESARTHGVIPAEPSGFEYEQKMARFQERTSADRLAKLQFTEALQPREEFRIRPVFEDDPVRKRKQIRLDELKFKNQQDQLNMSEAEFGELADLINELDMPRPAAAR